MKSNLFRFILLLLIFSACKPDKEEKQLPLQLERKNITKKEGDNCDTEDFDCSIVSLEVIVAKGPEPVAENINRNIRRHVIRFISQEENPQPMPLEELAENFLQEQRTAAKNFSEEPPWEAYVNQSIFLRSDNLISIGTTAEIFSGGAHGYKSLSFLNFDPATGKILRNRELFSPEFSKYAEDMFRKEQGIPSEENINSTGFWFENNNFHLPENIGFTEDKIVLVYNSYEIAPYAAGDIYLEISREEAKPFLKIE